MRALRLMPVLLCGLVLAGRLGAQPSSSSILPVEVLRYGLDLRLDYTQERLDGTASITLRNRSTAPVTVVPLLLYRLMRVSAARDQRGLELAVAQQVDTFSDFPQLQVNAVLVTLGRALATGEATTISLTYGGYLLGYAETGMLYVQDRVDTGFTIIRPDAFAYPKPGVPSMDALRSTPLDAFSYEVRVTVPESLVVANGGRLVSRTLRNGEATYTYHNVKPAWRIDLAIARYRTLRAGATRVFYLPGDSAGAGGVLRAADTTLRLYTSWFGPLRDSSSFAVIEIPDGWGSQADVSSIIQSAAAFRDSTRRREVYHEVSHLWNVRSNDRPAPRWEEGLATFLEYLTQERIEGRPVLEERAGVLARWLRETLARDSSKRTVPMIAYGRAGLTDLSYSVGMLMFDVLYGVVGQDRFNSIIGGYYREYASGGATTDDFVRYAKRVSHTNLDRFFDDWIYTARWYDRIAAGATVPDLVRYYRSVAP